MKGDRTDANDADRERGALPFDDGLALRLLADVEHGAADAAVDADGYVTAR